MPRPHRPTVTGLLLNPNTSQSTTGWWSFYLPLSRYLSLTWRKKRSFALHLEPQIVGRPVGARHADELADVANSRNAVGNIRLALSVQLDVVRLVTSIVLGPVSDLF
jgi:hypothetical protein